MSRIALVTDSSCDLPVTIREEFNVEVVPIRVIFREGEYRDGIEISNEEVYRRLDTEVPTTSIPSPEDIHQAYRRLEEEGYTHCIVLSLSSALSGTFNTFRLVAGEFTGMKIHVINSKGLSWALGFQVIEAAKMIRKGTSFDEIIEKMEEVRRRIEVYFTLETLDYLERGGRIGKLTSFLGSILNLKPIITFDAEGKLHPHAIARGRKQSIKKLLQPVLRQLESVRADIAVLQARAESEAEILMERLSPMKNVRNLYLGSISPALVVHSGPGLLGVVIHPCEE